MEQASSILIVDDEIIISAFLQQVLESRGYVITGVAVSGEDALAMIEEKKPDLVLMDIMLAGKMDGIEAADEIRKRYDLPVVYLTGNPEEQNLARVKVTEPFGYIIKPATGGEIHTAVSIALYRHGMQRMLRGSESRFRIVVESATDGICVIKNGLIKYINPALQKITGFTREDRGDQEHSLHEYIYPDELQHVGEMFRRHMDGIDKEQRYETALRHKSGKKIYIELKASWMEEYEGGRAMLVFIRDITEQRIAQEALKRSELRFKSYFDLPLVGFAIMSIQGQWLQVNDKFCDMTGYTSAELENMNWRGMTPEEDLNDEQVRFDIDLAEGTSSATREKRYRRKDGILIDVMMSSFCVRNSDGSPDYLVAVIQDITERKGMTDLLLESEERFRVISENSPILIIITRFDGTILYANRQAESLFQEDREEIIGKISIESFYLNPSEREYRVRLLKETGRIDGLEVDMVRRDSSVIHGLLYAQIITYEREKVVLAVINDITNLQEAQRNLRFTRFAVDRAGDAAYWTKSDGSLIYVNDATCRMLGYSSRELMNLYIWDVDSFLTPDRWTGEWEILKKKGSTTQLSEHLTKGGNRIPVEVNSNFISYEDEEYLIAFSRDISERLRIEEALWESRTRLYEIIHFLPVATFAIDKEGCIIAWNRAMEQMTGRREADMLGKGDYEYAVPFYGERRPIMIDHIFSEEHEISSLYDMVHREGDYIFGETELTMPDGTTLYLWGKASPLYNRKGEVVGAIESIRDVTDYKLAENALKTSEEKYRAMAETMPDAVTVVDIDYKISYVSPQSVELHGYDSAEEMLGIDMLQLVPPEDRDRAAQLIPLLKEKGIVHDQESRILRKDGSSFHGEVSAALIHDARGDPHSWIIITKDITERKLAEEKIRLSEEKYSKAFMSSPLVVLLFNLADERFMEVNGRFLELSGFAREELINHTPIELGIFADNDDRERMLHEIRESGKVRDFEIAVRVKDGSVRQTMLSGDIIQIEGKPMFLATMVDITEMKELQKEISTAIEQERQRIGRDLHDDLGQTLTGVTFLLQSLKQDLEGSNEALMGEVVKIDDLVRSAVAKTRSISRILSPVEMGETGLASALAEMVQQIEKIFVITCQFHGREDLTVSDGIVATNLFYIAREAVTNALKHSNANRIDVYLRTEGDSLVLEVQDDGTGIREGKSGKGMGLRIMQYRAGIIGAQVDYVKSEDSGFSVIARKKITESGPDRP